MFEIKKNKKNKSAVILNPERSEWVSRSHVTSVEIVVNDGAKTKPHHALRRSLRALAYGSTLKMTEKALSFLRLRGASGAQGISTSASCRKAHKRRFLFNSWLLRFTFAQPLKMTVLAFLLSLNLSTSWAVTCTRNGTKLTITGSGNEEFTGCSDDSHKTATEVTIGTGVTSIGYLAFSSRSLTSITIPEGVTSIGEAAFWGAESLTSITLPDSLTSIGNRAFERATSLTSITIPEGVTSIGDDAFFGASSLTSITIPEGVTSIGNSAFAYASSLTSITIPEGVTSLKWGAFRDASSLESITLPGSLTSVASNLFFRSDNLTEINCAGTESECAALSTLLGNKGYLDGRNFKRVPPVTKCSSYTSDGCNDCYAGYAFGNGSCHACGTGKNCHWDDTAEKVVFDGCKGKYLRKENECVAASQGCGANFRLNDGECDRLRYTPAEAAKVLTDDNNNSVTITFKK